LKIRQIRQLRLEVTESPPTNRVKRSSYPMMQSSTTPESFAAGLTAVSAHIAHRFTTLNDSEPIPSRQEIDTALRALPTVLPNSGIGIDATVKHLLEEITPGLLRGHAGSRFYGLVTGGVTPASQCADILGTSCECR
jgi:hypothetical protein